MMTGQTVAPPTDASSLGSLVGCSFTFFFFCVAIRSVSLLLLTGFYQRLHWERQPFTLVCFVSETLGALSEPWGVARV